VFREVYKVTGLPLVVKFPLCEGDDDEASYRAGKHHSTMEVRKIEQLWKTRWMRKYLPKIYHHDRETGVLVMHYYLDMDKNGKFEGLSHLVWELIWRKFNVSLGDIHSGNIRSQLNKKGKNLVFIDLGY